MLHDSQHYSTHYRSELLANGAWLFVARCRGMDPDTFFPASQKTYYRDVETAKAFCAQCQVCAECLQFNLTAISARDDDGVWGGTTADERKAMRRERRLKERGRW